MHGIIIVNQNVGHNAYKIKRFQEEANSLGLTFDVVINNGTLAKLIDGEVITSLKGDFVIYLDKDIYLAKLLYQAGFKMFPSPEFLKVCDDKMLTYIALSNKGIKMPNTMAAPLIYNAGLKEENYSFLKEVEKTFSYPLIAKRVYGSLGEGVYLIHNYEELRDFYDKYYLDQTLYQEYIDTSYGRSIRVLVIDGKIFGAFERYNETDFRSNYSSNAKAKEVKLDKKTIKVVDNIIKILNIEYAGIDLLYGKDEPVLCEVNSNAFFEEFEKVTKTNAAKAYLEMIIKKIGGKR